MDSLHRQIKEFEFAKVGRKGRVGVTTFYKSYFRRGKAFKSPVKFPKKRGLQIGRVTDLNLREYANSGRLPRRTELGKYIYHVDSACKQHGLRMVRAQVPVAAGPIHTQLDGIAVTLSGQIAIIELKTTQQSRAQHKQTYKTPCTNLRTLHHSGAMNNEYTAHQWQCGYGMAAFKETYPEFAAHDIIGCVIVACDDGAMLYRCTIEPNIDSLPSESVPAPAESSPELSMFKASEFEKGGPLIDALIAKHGFTNLRKTGVLLSATAHDGTQCLFGILPLYSQTSAEKRKSAVSALKNARGRKTNKRAFVVHRTASGWELALVGKKKIKSV